MARANFVKSAQKDIYQNGKYVKYTSKKGKREGQELSKLDRTIPQDNNDKIIIAKGESYYWWAFKTGGKRYSKTRPKASQLTQSAFLSQVYEINERISELDTDQFNEPEDLQLWKDEIVSELESLRDEQEEKKSNMPDGLQEGPTGELLQERYDGIDELINELEGVDCDDFDFDEDAAKEEITEEIREEMEEPEYEPDEQELEEKVSEKKQEAINDWLQEKIGELSGLSYGGS